MKTMKRMTGILSLWPTVLAPVLVALTFASCRSEALNAAGPMPENLRQYWLNGKAELSRYELTQARYGNLNRGEMLLIMVTEPFRTDKQVKSEITPGTNDQTILKAQSTRKFVTGIYDYAMTTTSFKPLASEAKALKVTGTSVEWCGQTFMQMNLKGDEYRLQSRSYFEAEGDVDETLAGAISEDEIWQRIRLQGDKLPTGEVKFFPSMTSTRLRHRKHSPLMAHASVTDAPGSSAKGGKNKSYTLLYAAGSADERRVEYIFEAEFPYKIVAFYEEYLDGFVKPRKLKTSAILKKQIMLDYWRTHDNEHEKLRKEFGIRPL